MSPLIADFFVLRSPLLPYDDLSHWATDLQGPRAVDHPGQLEAALAADRMQLQAGLADIVGRPEVRDALYLASPNVDASLGEWRADPDSRRGRRVERTLVRYLERMAARATPFGLFAGCAVGAVANRTNLHLPPRMTLQRHTRLDMLYLWTLVRALEHDPLIRPQLRFRPSSSLYRMGDSWHWTELTPEDALHSHRFRRRASSPRIDLLLERAMGGPTLAALAASLDIDLGDAATDPHLLESLIDQQLLVSELQPAVTGPEPIHRLIEQLDTLAPAAPMAAEAAATLRAVRDDLLELDAGGLGATPDAYHAITTRLETLPAPIDRSRLLQGELIKTPNTAASDGLTLHADVVADIGRGAEILRRLNHPAQSSMARFRERFISRYEGAEAHREVSLVEVLDPELGLGFGPTTGHDGGLPLLESFDQPVRSEDPAVRWGPRQTFLLAKLSAALATGATEITLSDADLDRLANEEAPPLPHAFAVSAVAVAPSAEVLTRGDVRLLIMGVSGPSGARMLGRFCHGDPVLRQEVERHVEAEAQSRPDAIFAEIAHAPEPRAGNVLHRPCFREYEITYLGASGLPLDRQIPVTDLTVAVDGDRVVLRSARLGREVIPRLSSAQNYFHPRTTVLYRFLGALQDQGIATKLGWDWGPLANATFLPRVSTGRLVLCRARWRLDADEIGRLGSLQDAKLYLAVQRWRAERGIPRHVRLADHDNELLIDFDNVLSVESFAQLLAGRDEALLVEAFPGPDDLCVSGPEGRFFHELVVPFLQVDATGTAEHTTQAEPACSTNGTTAAASVDRSMEVATATDDAALHTARRLASSATSVVRRRFPPGSAWLFAKLYTGPSAVDGLLRTVVRPLIDRAMGSGAADGWFFIRYSDPDWHLRLRIHGDPTRLHAEVLPLLHDAISPLLDNGQVHRIVLETYEREIERYGGPVGMPLCEHVFQADSAAALEIVEAFDDEVLADARASIAVAGMDVLLDGLGLSLTEKIEVASASRDGFAREQRADQKLLRQIGDRFRVERASLEAVFDLGSRSDATGHPVARAVEPLRRFAERLAPSVARLRAAAQRGDLAMPVGQLAPSLLHMHANRMLRSDQRRQELVLYDFLYRLYDARAARARTAGAR